MDEDYDLVPHHDVEQLKKEMEAIKDGNFPASHDLLANLKELNDSLKMLQSLFQEAADSIKVEETSGLGKKVDTIAEQNTKLAEGIVALADMVKDVQHTLAEHKHAAPKPAPAPSHPPPEMMPRPPPTRPQPPQPRPMPSGDQRGMPDLGMSDTDPSIPPMPSFDFPEPEKKKGLFARFTKK